MNFFVFDQNQHKPWAHFKALIIAILIVALIFLPIAIVYAILLMFPIGSIIAIPTTPFVYAAARVTFTSIFIKRYRTYINITK